MDCRQCRQEMDACLDGELSGEERAELEAHLHTCPACAREWETRRQLREMLGYFRGQAPDFPVEVIRRLHTEEAARRRRQWVRMGAAAAACVVLVLGTLFGRQQPKETARDVAEPACYAADEERPLDGTEQEAVICMTAADRDWIADALACQLGDRAAEYMQEQDEDLWLQGISDYAESLRALLQQRGYALPEGAEEVLLCIEEE